MTYLLICYYCFNRFNTELYFGVRFSYFNLLHTRTRIYISFALYTTVFLLVSLPVLWQGEASYLKESRRKNLYLWVLLRWNAARRRGRRTEEYNWVHIIFRSIFTDILRIARRMRKLFVHLCSFLFIFFSICLYHFRYKTSELFHNFIYLY